MFIKGSHPAVEENYRSYLTAKALSGQAGMYVQSVADLAVNDFICIGLPTEDLTEEKRILTIVGKLITLSANLDNTHAENTKIFVIKYDKIKFQKATTIAGVYSTVATKDIAIGEQHTIYEDPNALTTDYYKVFHFNSYTSESSPLSDPISSSGYARSSLLNLVETVYKRFGDTDKTYLAKDEITDWINEVKDIMVNDIAESNEKYFNKKVTIAMEADGEQDLPADFKKEQKVRFGYAGSETGSKRAAKEELENIDDEANTYDQNSPVWYFNNFTIGSRPKGTSAGNIYLWYEAHPVDLANDSDTLPKPINNYTHVVIDYVMGKAFEKSKKFTVSDRYAVRFETGKNLMIEQINNLSLDENRSVQDDENW